MSSTLPTILLISGAYRIACTHILYSTHIKSRKSGNILDPRKCAGQNWHQKMREESLNLLIWASIQRSQVSFSCAYCRTLTDLLGTSRYSLALPDRHRSYHICERTNMNLWDIFLVPFTIVRSSPSLFIHLEVNFMYVGPYRRNIFLGGDVEHVELPRSVLVKTLVIRVDRDTSSRFLARVLENSKCLAWWCDDNIHLRSLIDISIPHLSSPRCLIFLKLMFGSVVPDHTAQTRRCWCTFFCLSLAWPPVVDTSKTFSLEVEVECIRPQVAGEISTVGFSILIRRINKYFVESSYLSCECQASYIDALILQ